MNKVNGYKAFNGDMTNRYGRKFEEGKIYTVDGELAFGLKGNGFHFCRNLEDTLKFFDDDRKIARVVGSGELLKRDDYQQDFYDMYVARELYVDRVLSREEIISLMLRCGIDYKVVRFLMYFPLTEEEKTLFRLAYKNSINVLNAISYYQDGDIDVYNRQYIKSFNTNG